jgi:hypothetical protein
LEGWPVESWFIPGFFFFFSKGVLALRKLLGFFAWMGKS